MSCFVELTYAKETCVLLAGMTSISLASAIAFCLSCVIVVVAIVVNKLSITN